MINSIFHNWETLRGKIFNKSTRHSTTTMLLQLVQTQLRIRYKTPVFQQLLQSLSDLQGVWVGKVWVTQDFEIESTFAS